MIEVKVSSLQTPITTASLLDEKWDLKMHQKKNIWQSGGDSVPPAIGVVSERTPQQKPRLLLLGSTLPLKKVAATVAYYSGSWGIAVILVHSSKLDAKLYSRVGLLIWKFYFGVSSFAPQVSN
jgi:hypothetical protein